VPMRFVVVDTGFDLRHAFSANNSIDVNGI
jgi:hypothetical protein